LKKQVIYLMPGMAASPKIFEYLEFPDTITVKHLSWIPPKPDESISSYAQRMSQRVVETNVVLLGVSFGGVLVQEMAQFINCKKIILVSSVKSPDELSLPMKLAQKTQAHKLLPTQWIKNLETLALFVFGSRIQKRVALYQKYLSERDPVYLNWAIDRIVHWGGCTVQVPLVHIHGKQDTVFPIKNITPPVMEIEGGHAMIINKKTWFNKHLPNIILAK
jgi:pimeloyl-ACP methyl ester carboxylesterase